MLWFIVNYILYAFAKNIMNIVYKNIWLSTLCGVELGLTDQKSLQKIKTTAIGPPSSKPAAITCFGKDQRKSVV